MRVIKGPAGIVAHCKASVEWHQVDIASVKGAAVETGRSGIEQCAQVDAGVTRWVFEGRRGIVANGAAAIGRLGLGVVAETGAEIDVASVKGGALL